MLIKKLSVYVACLLWSATSSSEMKILSGGELQLQANSNNSKQVHAHEKLKQFTESSKYLRYSKPVGMIKIELQKNNTGNTAEATCTATLISRAHLLTANHCIDRTQTLPGKSLHGFKAVKIDLVLDYLSNDDLPVLQRFPVKLVPLDSSHDLDFAILELVNPFNSAVDFEVSNVNTETKPSFNEELFMIHHPDGFPKHVSRSLCRNKTLSNDDTSELIHECSTFPGSSGAPIFSDNSISLLPDASPSTTAEQVNITFNPPKIIAIHTGAGDFTKHGTFIRDILSESCELEAIVESLDPQEHCGPF